MSRSIVVAVAVILSLSAPAAFGAAAAILYGTEYTGQLYRIDPSNGSHVLVGSPSSYMPGLAFNRLTQTMYGTSGNQLFTVNLTTGAAALVGAHGSVVTGLAFSGDFTKLYAIGTNGQLYWISPSTGLATAIGPMGGGAYPNSLDLATNAAGVVYAGFGGLYTVNTTTGAATFVAPITGASVPTSIAFDGNDVLYGIDISSDALYKINTSTGAVTVVGGNVGDDVRGLAFALPPPFDFDTTQTIDGKTVTCASVTGTASYTECTGLKVDGLYFPNGISCGPSWSSQNSDYTDTQGFCQSLTGSLQFEAFYTCSSTQPRATWFNHVWGTFNDNGYTESVRCYRAPATVPGAAMSIGKSAASAVFPGDELAYTITVDNDGPAAGENVSWSDTLPAGTTFASLTNAGGWDCSAPQAGQSGTVSCALQSMTEGLATFTLTVNVGASVSGGTVLSNTAEVQSDNGGSDSANATTTVAMTADLQLSKSAQPDPVIAGTNLTYTITATNAGPDTATDATWSDTLPAGTTFVSLDAPSGWSCTPMPVGGSGTLTCSKPSFAPGSALFTLIVAVSPTAVPGTEVSNSATIGSDTADLVSDNESASATSVVQMRLFSVGFDVYNQGRSLSAESLVRAYLSDRSSLGAFPLPSGNDDEVPVELAAPAPSCTGGCTPELPAGELAHYNASFVAPASFGRLDAAASPNSATPNADGSFTVESTGGSTGRVAFLFERYLWIDADSDDEAGQLLPALKENDAQGVPVAVSAPRFGQLSHLSASFLCETGGSGEGSPRLEVHFEGHGTLRIQLGAAPGFSEPCETLSAFSGQNVLGSTGDRYDTTGLIAVSGSLSASTDYADALSSAGPLVISSIDFVASDSGLEGRRFRLFSIDPAPPTP